MPKPRKPTGKKPANAKARDKGRRAAISKTWALAILARGLAKKSTAAQKAFAKTNTPQAGKTFGVRRLGELLAEHHGIVHEFVDIPNPV